MSSQATSSERFVIPRFRQRILSHMLQAYADARSPLTLAIQGRPGDGKSFHVRETARSAGFQLHPVAASQLGSQWEAGGADHLRSAYLAVQATVEERGIHAVVLIEDIDLSPVGLREGSSYTVNTQLLAGFLMGLADGQIGAGGPRVPVIVTGNDLGTVHGPVLRHGRARVFSWEPDPAERSALFRAAAQDRGVELGDRECGRLAKLDGLTVAQVAGVIDDLKLAVLEQALAGAHEVSVGWASRVLEAAPVSGAAIVEAIEVAAGGGRRLGRFLS